MRGSTLTVLKAAVGADPIRNERERQAILEALGIRPAAPADPLANVDQVVSIEQAARLLSSSKRLVQGLLARGVLKRVILPGRKLAKGVLRSSLEKLIAEGASTRMAGEVVQ